jgi:lysophospholipase L1-like esterase
MTATLLSHFAEQGHTITLLGTLGEGNETNRNEGRAGWKASDYFTDRQYQGVVNPFYNPTTQTFDFGYYMNNQGYTSIDFVVIQLGINDFYNNASTTNIIQTTWDYIKRMVQSVLAFDANIKIILNLPTTPNSDQSQHSNILFLYQNTVIRYNEYAQAHALSEFGRGAVRTSYCHLILDPDTEIRDNVHPTVEGYQKMALELVNQINCWQNGY